MDSFRGSMPPTFISSYLDNQTPEIGISSNPSELPLPGSNEDTTITSRNITNPRISPQNTDSDEDVNAYAEAKALSMETGVLQVQEQSDVNARNAELSHAAIHYSQQVTHPMLPVRASTLIPLGTAGTSQASLTALESRLRVADALGSQLPGLLITTPTKVVAPVYCASTTDDDCESPVYEVPALPTQEHKVRFLTDLIEIEKTAKESSNVTCPSLYGGIPGLSESGVETSDLRVLSDETLRRSYTTIERMILDAVRGSPTIAPLRTSPFQLGARAQTPYRYADSDSSDAETGRLPAVDSEDQSATDYGEMGDSSTFEESDSAGEMALISATFEASNKNSAVKTTSFPAQTGLVRASSQETDLSSQDATLSEVREQTLKTKDKQQSKKAGKPKRVPQRGVPLREEFFTKIGWTRSFISGPADPIHNP